MEDLGELLDEVLGRRARGETPRPEEYRERAGAQFPELVELLAAESALDVALGLEARILPCPFGPYTLLAELGRGAVGVVYEALGPGGEGTVALKVLRAGLDASAPAVRRFRREIEACNRVRHPHVVEILDTGEVEGRPFYAMRFVRGRSLADAARRGALPPPRELCGRLADVADALHALHAEGIVHRDVKPSNILVEPDGRLVLGDLGLARLVEDGATVLTRTGEALGTPQYMSPEQLRGDRARIDARTDVYGLGATMYELFAGRPLFEATEFHGVLQKVLLERPRPLGRAAPGIPAECERIVMTALEKEPGDRYGSAAALRDDLRACAGGRPVAGRPVSETRRRLRLVRRRWRLVAAAAAVVLAWCVWHFNRPATLRVACYPAAEILVDGEPMGTTPRVLELAPGAHELTLRTGGFLDQSEILDLDAGETRTLRLVLVASDPEDREALAKLAERFGMALAELEEAERVRGGDDDRAWPLFPRGLVRREDLDSYRIDVGPAFRAAGTLEFRSGGRVLFTQRFAPRTVSTVAELPAAVRAADAGTWGYYPDAGEPVTADWQVVEDPAELAQLEEDLAGQDPRALAYLRANLLLKHGLHAAAWREASGQSGAHACAVQQAALRGLGLGEGPLAAELLRRIDALPAR